MPTGYATELLLASGAFISSQNLGLGIALLALGCLSAIVRFAAHLSFSIKKQEWYSTVNGIIKQISEIPIENKKGPFEIFKGNEEIH